MNDGEQKKNEELILISVIVPVYNVERYLAECVDSILGQTYGNLEIILVDDGSTDGSGIMCDQYAQKDARIHVIHQKNQGLSSARNTGLDMAQGEWIAFVDSDDWLEPNTYEVLLQMAKENKATISSCCLVHEWKNHKEAITFKEELVILRGYQEIMRGVRKYYWIQVCGRIYHRSFWDKGIRFNEGQMHEDVDILYALYENSDYFACTNKVLYHYRKRKSSLSHEKSFKRLFDLWHARVRGFNIFEKKVPEDLWEDLFLECVNAACKLWINAAKVPKKIRMEHKEQFKNASLFFREHSGEVKQARFSLARRFICFLLRHDNAMSFYVLTWTNALRDLMLKKKEPEEWEKFE